MLKNVLNLARLLAVIVLLAPAALSAQTAAPAPAVAVPHSAAPAVPAPSAEQTNARKILHSFNIKAWQEAAESVEALLATPSAQNAQSLTEAQDLLAEWSKTLLSAQNLNAARITTLKAQIKALGPIAPTPEAEPAEIAARRAALEQQFTSFDVPVREAKEAYSRAEGLSREVATILSEKRALSLIARSPSPLNPQNWAQAANVLFAASASIANELSARLSLAAAYERASNNSLAILFFAIAGLVLLWRGRASTQAFFKRVPYYARPAWRPFFDVLILLAGIFAPYAGLLLLTKAAMLTGFFGIVGTRALFVLPTAGLILSTVYWISAALFPVGQKVLPLELSDKKQSQARASFRYYGFFVALDMLLDAAMGPQNIGSTAQAVVTFAIIILVCVSLFTLGRILAHPKHYVITDSSEYNFGESATKIAGRGAMLIALVGALAGAAGYIGVASAVVFPAGNSLILFAALYLVQHFVTQTYGAAMGEEKQAANALGPVLIGFVLCLISVPWIAALWGVPLVKNFDELWSVLNAGFKIGDVVISPSRILLFFALFGIGFSITHTFKNSLKKTILPRTQMDKGAQNAVVSGVGYAGITLAGLIAVNTAGFDLSGLAIVAGALSVGIGFGMQNIVSNFVSGIILLIERPISAGDWIKVGDVQGIVKSISVRSTRIETFDRTDVIVPNTDLVSGHVTNWTGYSLEGRLIVPISVAYGTDPKKVDQILHDIGAAHPAVLRSPAHQVIFCAFGADSLDFELRVFLQDIGGAVRVHSELNHMISERFSEEGIEIPFAQRDIYIKNLHELATPIAPDKTQPT